ncbi:hypothetical protein QQP08_018171 [Theobroma cacao]|nr:hypothetical protein QQP08_018171 [Theobroma cacao]
MLQKQLFNIVGIQFGMAMAYGYGSLPGDQLMCCTCTDVIVAISSFRCPLINPSLNFKFHNLLYSFILIS